MSTFGRKGVELVREMYEADRSHLPAYNVSNQTHLLCRLAPMSRADCACTGANTFEVER